MLVLSRKPGETICIGEDVFISIIRVRGNRVQLGIRAPEAISIFRSEIAGLPPENELQPELAEAAASVH
jgi:carbon storage regulator